MYFCIPLARTPCLSSSYYRKTTESITKEEIYTADWERTLITDNETEGNISDIKSADKYYTRIWYCFTYFEDTDVQDGIIGGKRTNSAVSNWCSAEEPAGEFRKTINLKDGNSNNIQKTSMLGSPFSTNVLKWYNHIGLKEDEVGRTCTADGTGTAGHKSGTGQLRLSYCQLSQKDYFHAVSSKWQGHYEGKWGKQQALRTCNDTKVWVGTVQGILNLTSRQWVQFKNKWTPK